MTYAAANLPQGLTIDSSTGVISGVPTTAGTVGVTITASNGVNPQATQIASITVAPNAGSADLVVAGNPSDGGTVLGGGTYAIGSTQTITAIPNAGYLFTQWNDGNTSASRQVALPASGATYSATFVLIQSKIIGLGGNLAFGNVLVGSTATSNLSITNNGNTTLAVTDITYPAGFSGYTTANVPAGGSVDLTVTFAPTVAQSYNGNITVTSDATSGSNMISVSGVGIVPAASIAPLSRGALAAGEVYDITVTSSTTWTAASDQAWATLSQASGSGNGTVTVIVAANSTTDSRTATITIGGQTHTLTQAGVAVSKIIGLVLNPGANFGNVAVNNTTTATLTISNSGNTSLAVGGINYPPGFSGNWSSGLIPPGGAQNVTVTFAPTAVQSYSGTITVNSDKTSGTNTISASGSGVEMSMIDTELFSVDFNDNQMPVGWRQGPHDNSGSYDFANGRMNANYSSSSNNYIIRNIALAAETSRLEIKYRGNTGSGGLGAAQQVYVVMSPSLTINCAHGYGTWAPAGEMLGYIGDLNGRGAEQAMTRVADIFDYTVVIENGTVKFRGVRVADGTVVFDLQKDYEGLQVATANQIYFNVNNWSSSIPTWIDDIQITAYTSVPSVAPTITTQPQSQTVAVGTNVTFTIVATGSPDPSFLWQVSTDGGNNWSDLTNIGVYSGAMTATLTLTGATSGMDGYLYRAVAANDSGSIASASAKLTVAPMATRVMTLSGDLSFGDVTAGLTAARTLSVGNAGNSVLTVSSIVLPAGFTADWASGMIAAGASQNVTVTFAPSVVQAYGGTITVSSDKTDGANTIIASGMGLTATSAPAFSAQPQSQSVTAGTNVSLWVTATGNPAPILQWQVSTDAGSNWSNITNDGIYTGAATSSLMITGVTLSMDQYRFRVLASNSLQNNVASTTAVLAVTAGLSGAGFVLRTLPDYYQPGGDTTVTLTTAPSAGVQVYALQDGFPIDWTFKSASAGGTYDSVNKLVKFGPYFDASPRTLTYVVTAPSGAGGDVVFSGSGSADGENTSIIGDNQMTKGLRHPADINPADDRISIGEVTAYGAAWKQGNTWTIAPTTIPIDYLTRAGYLWKGGESYGLDAAAATAPQWWILRTASSAPLRAYAMQAASEAPGQRSITGGEVTVVVTPPTSAFVYAVEESVPSGLTVSGITDSGVFDEVNRKVKWGPFFDNTPRTLGYTCSGPDGIYSLAGTVSVDGVNSDITGSDTLSLGAVGVSLWRLGNFTSNELADPNISDLAADPDGDGLPNLVEYALDLDPKGPDATGLPGVSVVAAEWVYTYSRPADRPDLNYEVQVSTNLIDWGITGVVHERIATDGVTEQWRARYPVSAANVFFRLKVTQVE